MKRMFLILAIVAIPVAGTAQDWISHFGDTPAHQYSATTTSAVPSNLPNLFPEDDQSSYRYGEDFASFNPWTSAGEMIVRGQESGGDGAGASAATDPSAILTQLQFQNVFTPESYNASGYANTFIVQPVLPFPVAMPGLKELFPAHIVRPTLPFPAPTADPDGPAGVESGMGDLTYLDLGVHQIEGFGTALLGINAVLPTSTNRQLGRGEWQLGPAAGLLYKQIPKTLLGILVTTQFSFESDAQQVNVSPIVVRHLRDQMYIGWGSIFWTFNTGTGDYNIPLELRFGKVCKIGKRPVNISIEPFYTPAGLHSGLGGDQWGVKLNAQLLFPEKKFKAPLAFLWGGSGCHHGNSCCCD